MVTVLSYRQFRGRNVVREKEERKTINLHAHSNNSIRSVPQSVRVWM